jgi:glucosylceramidase
VTEPSRRDFVKVATLGAALATRPAAAHGLAKYGALPVNSTAGRFRVWVTDDDRRLAEASAIISDSSEGLFSEPKITVDPEKNFQPVFGFGAEFTDTACYLLNQLPDQSRAELFHDLFHPTEMGLNFCRVVMGSGDSATSVYSYDDGDPDPELKRFSIEHDRAYILPILRQARAINPDLFLYGTPFSPPGWMKDNGSMLGGCMHRTYMPSYANYFVKFLQAYEAEGVLVQAVTVQNEVDADQQGLMPACYWSQDYEADFVRFHLGPQFERSGIKAKIWIIDHNYNLWGRAIAELETPGVRKYTNTVAWHGYTGEPEWMSRVQNVFPDLEMHWTEGGPDYNDPEYSRCWALWGQKFTAILRNSCRGLNVLNFATDEHGRPNVGPYPCGGLLTVDSKTKDVYHSGQYWAMAHFARFVPRGSFRVDSQASTGDLAHCAFKTAGSIVLVITNAAAQRTCSVELGDTKTQIELPANSVVTVVQNDAQPAGNGA